MAEREFKEYWWIYLERNEEWKREDERTEGLMKGHFAFIEEQESKGNLFVAIPMTPSGGQYFFDGNIPEEEMKEIIDNEPSIGQVFTHKLQRAYVGKHHVIFTKESMKRIEIAKKAREDTANQPAEKSDKN